MWTLHLPAGTSGKEPAWNAGDRRDVGLIPGQEDPLVEGMTTYSSTLAWRITWTEEPGRATVRRVTQSGTWLKQLSMHTQNINVTGLRPFINLHTGAKWHYRYFVIYFITDILNVSYDSCCLPLLLSIATLPKKRERPGPGFLCPINLRLSYDVDCWFNQKKTLVKIHYHMEGSGTL